MQSYWLVVAILGVWRVTHLLHAEDGPFDLVIRLRRLAGNSVFGKLLDCFYCLSLWLAAPFALLLTDEPRDWVLLWLALSGGASLLEQLTSRSPQPEPPLYVEDPDRSDGPEV